MTDVLIRQTDEGGDISVVNGTTELHVGFEVAAYLSLFGGNAEDDGSSATTRKGWWGNVLERDEAFQYISRTQNLLQGLPITSANIRELEVAAEDDLAWFVSSGAASSAAALVTVQDRNRVLFTVTILAEGEELVFVYSANWKAAA